MGVILTDLLITQKFTLYQMVDFLYDMDIYDTNMEHIKNQNYNDSLLRYYVIITLQNRIKSRKFRITKPIYEIKI